MVRDYDAPGYSYSYAMALDTVGNVYVTGKSSNGTTYDYATIKYVQSPASVESEGDVPAAFILEQNYPNPFNPSTTIKFQVPNSSFVNLKVYDVLGNEVAILVNEEKPAGSYEVNFSAKSGSASGGNAYSLSSGIYFYKLQAGSFVETKKMILMK